MCLSLCRYTRLAYARVNLTNRCYWPISSAVTCPAPFQPPTLSEPPSPIPKPPYRDKHGYEIYGMHLLSGSHKILQRKRILLVDDVFTTGTTLNECAKTLRKAGSGPVFALTLARTIETDLIPDRFFAEQTGRPLTTLGI